MSPVRQSFLNDQRQFCEYLCRAWGESPTYRFLSISVEIPFVDPLAVLQDLGSLCQPLFYMENRQQQVAILGFDMAISYTCKGAQRFTQARTFIQDCVAKTLRMGAIDQPMSGPHFFCTFTFSANHTLQMWDKTSFPDATVLLPKWQIMRSPQHCLLVANWELESSPLYPEQVEQIAQDLGQRAQMICQVRDPLISIGRPALTGVQGEYVIPMERFKTQVERAIQAITKHQLKKMVLANAMDVQAPRPFQIGPSLQILRDQYPGCYVFAIRQSAGTTFLGASPEVLLRTRDQQLMTEAIAGSAPRGQTEVSDAALAHALLHGHKERYEHQVVVDFILECLRQLGLDPQVTRSLSLRQLSNIQHLWTPIQAPLLPTLHPLDILAHLHPTPAVAGVPRDQVLAELPDYEPFDRLLFAAPLGWVDALGNSEFAVGIRSALIERDRARLYAGAGIVAGSQPDQEMAEVDLKLRTLLEALV